jgi:hypothetical protein
MTDEMFVVIQPGRLDDEGTSYCPACGDPIDYCQGHGPIGDPAGYRILWRHDNGDHRTCHPSGCDDAPHLGRILEGTPSET